MNKKPSQLDFISKYIKENREEFNKDLFYRNEDDIIKELKKIILSCQRNKNFIIRVDGFEVVNDYGEIYRILEQYESINSRNKNRSSKSKKDRMNQFSYINLKESDIKLLIVNYYLKAKSAKDKNQVVEEKLNVLIAVPRYVHKYYFKISGNYYSAMWQIVDSSTYNNMTSNKKTTPEITLKKDMPPIQIYKNTVNLITYDKEAIQATLYTSYIFNASFPCTLYIFAKYGYYKAMEFLGVSGIITITQAPNKNKEFYSFRQKSLFVNIPKYIFDRNLMCQSIVTTLLNYISKSLKNYEDLFGIDFWQTCLGGEFIKLGTVEKGRSLLDSIESIYDVSAKETIVLPEEDKADVYCILRWMMREFTTLQNRSNLDIKYKKLVMPEYIASLYSMKICNALYTRISGKKGEITISDLRKVVKIAPMYLLQSISKCNLVNYRDLVNDLDWITALAYTSKRINQISNGKKKKENQIPKIYRYIHPSQMGRIDIDSSHKSDPGTSGNLCPMVDTYDNYFSKYKEPNEWEKNFAKLLDNYKEIRGMKDLFTFKEKILNVSQDKNKEKEMDNNIKHLGNLVPLFVSIDDDMDNKEIHSMKIPLEKSGTITYSGGN